MIKQFVISILLFFLFNHCFAQDTSPIILRDNMLWVGYYNTIKLNDSWSINTDVQYRSRNELKNISQVLVRPGVSYKVNDKVEITAGLAHFRHFITNHKTRGEWRPWQEMKISDQIGKVKVTHRFRIEQRFNELVLNNETSNEYQFNWRFRYRLDLRFAITKNSENANILYGILGNELMINAGNTIVYNYFDQNRLYAGLNFEINRKVSLQIQYMHLWQQGSNGLNLNSTSVLRFNIYHTISL